MPLDGKMGRQYGKNNTQEECARAQTHTCANITSRSTSQDKMEGDKGRERRVRMRKVRGTEGRKSEKDIKRDNVMTERVTNRE